MKILVPVDLNKNEVQNIVIQNLSTAPSSPKTGQIYYNTTDSLLYQYDGSAWSPVGAPYELPTASATTLGGVKVGTGLGIGADGKLYVTGDATVNSVEWSVVQNTPTTIAGYGITDASVNTANKTVSIGGNSVTVPTQTSQLTNNSGFITSAQAPIQTVNGKTGTVVLVASDVGALSSAGGELSGNLVMNSNKITGVATGTSATDAVNKQQLDNAIAGLGTVFDLKGSKTAVSNLPSTGNQVGDVWFVEEVEAGYIWITNTEHPNGTWEQFGAPIDLTGYLTKAGLAQTTGSATNNTMSQNAITVALNSKANASTVSAIPIVKTAVGTIGTSATSVGVSYNGTIIGTYAKDASGEQVIVDVDYATSVVTFSTASAPSTALTCTVVYI